MNANYFFVFSMTILLMGCNDKYSKTVYDPNDAEEIELNHQTSDIKITPLFCSEPMDGILQAKLYKDYLFLLGDKREHVYCIKNDSVISILNNKGRGHGEYTFIRDMAYDETNSVLYVKAENVILKYRVPSMSYLGELEANYTTSGMLVLNPDELLVHCNFWGILCVIMKLQWRFKSRPTVLNGRETPCVQSVTDSLRECQVRW